MAHYLVQVSYTSQALASLVKNPKNRIDVVAKTIQKLGGKVSGFWMAFGDYDVVGLIEMPDEVSAAAFALAVGGGGSVKAIKTTPLLSIEQGMAAMKKAAGSGYKSVGSRT
jgi:uncharacterized protein with GYD domain